MWLQQQRMGKRRDLLRKKSENGRRVTVSKLTEQAKEQSPSCLWIQKGWEQRQAISWDTGLVTSLANTEQGFRSSYFCSALLRGRAVNNGVSDGTCIRCFCLSLQPSPVIFSFVYVTAKVQQTGVHQSACILMSRRGNKGRVEIPTCH